MTISTFQNCGRLKLTISSPPANEADSKAAYFVATSIIPNDGTIIGDLYDAGDNLVARKRVYAYTGKSKNIPFSDLTDGQQGYLSGQRPAGTWEAETIKLWMSDRQKADGKGIVSVDDPYKYNEDDTVEQLLSKILSSIT